MSIQEEDIEVLQQRDLSKTEVSVVYWHFFQSLLVWLKHRLVTQKHQMTGYQG